VVPALTTVAQRKADMGRLAVEQLVARLDHEEPWVPGIVRLPMELRARESTGPVPKQAPAPKRA
jgi:DNA-binding LacI/PurR family transcriptional regulator